MHVARGRAPAAARELSGRSVGRGVQLVCGPPRADAAVLKDRSLLRCAAAQALPRLRRGRSPESAVALAAGPTGNARPCRGGADAGARSYQPLGKYWAFPVAGAAGGMAPGQTAVRPNAVTLASCGAHALGGSGGERRWLLGVDRPGSRWRPCLAVALVLDTADGRLARLQGTSSAFGRWLDQVLDELADMVLHAAIAWACVLPRCNQPGWLLLGMLYASSKCIFSRCSPFSARSSNASMKRARLMSRRNWSYCGYGAKRA